MQEIMSDIASALRNRIRNPIFGYFFLAFFLLNWKPLGILLFENSLTIEQRYDVFDQTTHLYTLLLYPAGLALTAAILGPWIALFSAWLARFPLRQHRFLVEDEAAKRELHIISLSTERVSAEADLEAARERAKIERANRLSEIEAIDNEGIREGLRQEILEEREAGDEGLDPDQEAILHMLSKSPHGSINFVETSDSYSILIDGMNSVSLDRRNYIAVKEAVDSLYSHGLVSPSGSEGFAITNAGYEYASSNFFFRATAGDLPLGIAKLLDRFEQKRWQSRDGGGNLPKSHS